jgi:hypothetical protein
MKIYTRTIPEDIETPSLYFPPPRTFDTKHTKMGYQVTYLLAVKLFHKTSAEALAQAEAIAESIRRNKSTIPLLYEDGTVTDEVLTISQIQCSIADEGVAIINLEWSQQYPYS